MITGLPGFAGSVRLWNALIAAVLTASYAIPAGSVVFT